MGRLHARRHAGRALVVAVIAVVALLPAVPAGAQVPSSRDFTDFACPTEQVPEDRFADVADSNIHESAVDCVAWYGVTTGTSPSMYSPLATVPRGQMASFIARLIDYVAERTASTTDGLPVAPSANAFPCDVEAGVHFDSIQRLAAAGVVDGTGNNAGGQACFAPDRPVSRPQMATFILNANRVLAQEIPASTGDFFVDDDLSPHEGSINALAAEGITSGVGTDAQGRDLYGVNANVRREEMASFLARTLDRLVELTTAEPPPTAELSPASVTLAQGTNYEGTVTASKDAIRTVTVNGCGLASPEVFQVSNEAGATSVSIRVPIAEGQAGLTCRLDVVASFVSGGRATTSAIIRITA